jgi:hypothetical protein
LEKFQEGLLSYAGQAIPNFLLNSFQLIGGKYFCQAQRGVFYVFYSGGRKNKLLRYPSAVPATARISRFDCLAGEK